METDHLRKINLLILESSSNYFLIVQNMKTSLNLHSPSNQIKLRYDPMALSCISFSLVSICGLGMCV